MLLQKRGVLKNMSHQIIGYARVSTSHQKTDRQVDVLKEKGLPHSKQTTKESQKAILDYMVETLKEFRKGDKVIFDRCPLDNLVYSMWAMSQEDSDVDEDFVDECIPIVREALTNLDIIFFNVFDPINIVSFSPLRLSNLSVKI